MSLLSHFPLFMSLDYGDNFTLTAANRDVTCYSDSEQRKSQIVCHLFAKHLSPLSLLWSYEEDNNFLNMSFLNIKATN